MPRNRKRKAGRPSGKANRTKNGYEKRNKSLNLRLTVTELDKWDDSKGKKSGPDHLMELVDFHAEKK